MQKRPLIISLVYFAAFSRAFLPKKRQCQRVARTLSQEDRTVTHSNAFREFLKSFDSVVIKRRIEEANRADKFDSSIPLITSTDLLSTNNWESKQSFLENVKSVGGWGVVAISEKDEILKDMWDSFPFVFDGNSIVDVRKQILSRDSTQANGYEYVEVSFGNDSFKDLERGIGQEKASKLHKSFDFIGDLASTFCESLSGVDINTNLLHHNSSLSIMKYSGSMQRYARYSTSESKENLRSHGDWTFATVVPMSTVPGLEVYTGDAWVCPEEVMKQQGPPSRLITIMAGKWLEILTEGDVPTTIHRVVSQDEGRLSAPFFLRPKLAVIDKAEKLPGVEAVQDMSKFLKSFQ